jgi:hypothetical protein
MNYRALNKSEIRQLEYNGCQAKSWEKINVSVGFDPARVKNVEFAGKVNIGAFKKEVEVYDGIMKPAGLYNCHIQDCVLHDDVYISDVKFLSNYEIETNSVIYNVSALTVSGESSFGNGTEIEVLNEGGGRGLPIFDKLSAQIAYMMVIYRHDIEFIKKLTEVIRKYTDSRKSKIGKIGQHTRIFNSGTLRNIWMGDATIIEGAIRLEEGTIASTSQDSVYVGSGVIGNNFIILSGSKVESGALLTKCFVGQGVELGKQFSAENSAFFANCEGFHGEACSVFAGPYSVTHHKSTLLIAGMFSFFNAASGTNQSNHMYKLGPVHQGIFERGVKTGSFSYLLLPVRIGAYTAIVGKHYANFDTTDLPFSYITEVDGKSVLTPAMNLFTVGTRRDSMKWPNRDRRKDPVKYDLINFDLLSPYIVGKAQRAIQTLQDLYKNSPRDQEFILHQGIHIKRRLLKNTSNYYEMVIDIFIGEEILKCIKDLPDDPSIKDIKKQLSPIVKIVGTDWVDIAGLTTPHKVISDFMSEVRDQKVNTVEELNSALNEIYKSYDPHSWSWCADLIKKRIGKMPNELTVKQLAVFITNWHTSSLKLNDMIIRDAEKEFSKKSQIGFGHDGDEEVTKQDFSAVRGNFNNNKFVQETLADSEKISQIAEHWLNILQ